MRFLPTTIRQRGKRTCVSRETKKKPLEIKKIAQIDRDGLSHMMITITVHVRLSTTMNQDTVNDRHDYVYIYINICSLPCNWPKLIFMFKRTDDKIKAL